MDVTPARSPHLRHGVLRIVAVLRHASAREEKLGRRRGRAHGGRRAAARAAAAAAGGENCE